MKITPAQADPDALPYRNRDVVFRATRWGVVVQSKPRHWKNPPSKLQRQYRARFAWAAKFAADPNPLDYRLALAASKGTEQVARDILTMCALGRYWTFVNPDGTEWGHVEGPVWERPTEAEPAPEPTPPPPEDLDMQWNHWDYAFNGSFSTSAYCQKGCFFTPRRSVHLASAMAVVKVDAGGSYTASIGTLDSANAIATVTTSPAVVPGSSGHVLLAFQLEADLLKDGEYFILIGRTDQTGTYALPVSFNAAPKWLWPCSPGLALLVDTTTLTVGQTLTRHTSLANPPVGLELTAGVTA